MFPSENKGNYGEEEYGGVQQHVDDDEEYPGKCRINAEPDEETNDNGIPRPAFLSWKRIVGDKAEGDTPTSHSGPPSPINPCLEGLSRQWDWTTSPESGIDLLVKERKDNCRVQERHN